MSLKNWSESSSFFEIHKTKIKSKRWALYNKNLTIYVNVCKWSSGEISVNRFFKSRNLIQFLRFRPKTLHVSSLSVEVQPLYSNLGSFTNPLSTFLGGVGLRSPPGKPSSSWWISQTPWIILNFSFQGQVEVAKKVGLQVGGWVDGLRWIMPHVRKSRQWQSKINLTH